MDKCRSCAHNRQRCDETCFMRKYFPPGSDLANYMNVLQVYGEAHFTRLVGSTDDEEERRVFAHCLIIQATLIVAIPLWGSVAIMSRLIEQNMAIMQQIGVHNQQIATLREERDELLAANNALVQENVILQDNTWQLRNERRQLRNERRQLQNERGQLQEEIALLRANIVRLKQIMRQYHVPIPRGV